MDRSNPFTTFLAAALYWFRAGFSVSPIVPGTKRPAVKRDPWLEGLSTESIQAHWSAHPNHELGFILGDDVLVLDADTPLAMAALDILEQQFGVESNFVVNTRRGQHRYYRSGAGVIARSSAHSTEAHPKRIDVKAARSLVAMPPSPNKKIVRCDIETITDLVEVGQDFVDAVFRHNGSEPPMESAAVRSDPDLSQGRGTDHSLAELSAMVLKLDPDCGYDDWFHVLAAIHHATDGSEDGFALANEWSSRGDKYCGESELRAKWRSLSGYSGTPITVGTIKKMLQAQGDDWMEICAAVGPQFEVCEYEIVEATPSKPPESSSSTVLETAPPDDEVCDAPEPAERETAEPEIEVTPELILTAYSITGHLKQLKKDLVEQKYILEGIALLGQATVLYAAPNTGKTLLVLWLLTQAIKRGWVDPSKVFYINCDDSLHGLLTKAEIALAHGFHMVADGYQGFEIKELRAILLDVIDRRQARGVVLVLDTLKKFTDLMDKRTSTKFMKLMRTFVLHGGTVIMLAHANKKPGPDGKPIYSGVADILDDADCGYILWVSSEAGAAERVVEFEMKKRRGNVLSQVTYAYSGADGLPYEQLLDSVRRVDADEAVKLHVAGLVQADAPLIEAAKACIREGIVKRMELFAAIARRTNCGRRKAQELLDKYTGSDPLTNLWTFDVQARGAKVYRLLDPDEADADGDPVVD